MSLTNELKALDAFVALTSAFLLKNKDFRNNSCNVYNTKTKKSYLPQQIAEVVQTALEEHEQYKAIEDELDIELLTLIKAIKNGIWVKTKNGISQHFTISIRKWLQTNTYCLYYRPYTHVWFKDYGKTWALTKEELEK